MRELRNTLLENTGDMEYYQKAESQLTDTAAQIRKTDGEPGDFI